MRRIILFLQLLLGVEMIYAQTETEILNYSRLSYAGSARAAAMGGAFWALGGDISSWNLNPAAIGVFRKSSVTYTSVLNFSGNESGELTARKTSYLIGTVGGDFPDGCLCLAKSGIQTGWIEYFYNRSLLWYLFVISGRKWKLPFYFGNRWRNSRMGRSISGDPGKRLPRRVFNCRRNEL